VEFTPTEHQKIQEINTLIDELKNWKKAIKQQQTDFEKERENFRQQIQENQRVLNETIAQHKSESQSLRRALEKQQKMFSQQQKEFSEERKKQNEKLNKILEDLQDAKEKYEEIQSSRADDLAAIAAAEKRYNELQEEFERQKSESCSIL